jgi:soluble lytic murein transglycosylase-like protein
LRFKLLTVTSLAAIVPGVSPLLQQYSAIRPAIPDVSTDLAGMQALAIEAARQHDVDPEMVLSVMAAESSYDPDAVSSRGAVGPMQLMPATARELGYDPSALNENIEAGTVYLGMMLSRYRHRKNGLELALAAYNAGPSSVKRHGGVPPFRETRDYIKRVLSRYREVARVRQASLALTN